MFKKTLFLGFISKLLVFSLVLGLVSCSSSHGPSSGLNDAPEWVTGPANHGLTDGAIAAVGSADPVFNNNRRVLLSEQADLALHKASIRLSKLLSKTEAGGTYENSSSFGSGVNSQNFNQQAGNSFFANKVRGISRAGTWEDTKTGVIYVRVSLESKKTAEAVLKAAKYETQIENEAQKRYDFGKGEDSSVVPNHNAIQNRLKDRMNSKFEGQDKRRFYKQQRKNNPNPGNNNNYKNFKVGPKTMGYNGDNSFNGGYGINYRTPEKNNNPVPVRLVQGN